MKFIKQLLCFHTSWARAGWIIQSARLNKNYYVCKDCGKLKNFGYRTVGHLVFPEQELRNLLDALESDLLSTPSQTLFEAAEEQQLQPHEIADRTKNLLDRVLKEHRQKKLRDAQKGVLLTREQFSRARTLIPSTIVERRALCHSVIKNNPTLTAQFRDLTALSDDDIQRILDTEP